MATLRRFEVYVIRYFRTSVVLHVTYGKSTPTSNDDPEVIRIHQNNKKILPVAGPGRELRQHHETELALFREQLGHVKDEALLENPSGHRLSYDEMAYLAGSLFGAGSDTLIIQKPKPTFRTSLTWPSGWTERQPLSTQMDSHNSTLSSLRHFAGGPSRHLICHPATKDIVWPSRVWIIRANGNVPLAEIICVE
ncbi:hypothetical protein BU15DRAFT_62610 [Melanogaster broomeanus]|nr:hypothetical protein BU15DRAFT_62610 [Melanogaster broomeanus]